MVGRSTDSESPEPRSDRLEGWKSIAAYLDRDVRTAKRWEAAEDLPVHRHQHHRRSSVFAYSTELDRWRLTRRPDTRQASWRAAKRALLLAAAVAVALLISGGGRASGPLGAAAQSAMTGMPRLVCEDCGDPMGSVTADGRFMATVLPLNLSDVGVRDLASLGLAVLHDEASTAGAALYPTVSPDGRQVAYMWTQGPETELRLFSRDAPGRSRVLMDKIKFGVPVAFTPRGDLIVEVSDPDDSWRLAAVSVATATTTPLASLKWRLSGQFLGGRRNAALSVDGNFIAYTALTINPDAPFRAAAATTLEDQIYMLAGNGREVALTTGAGQKRSPVWMPDGSRVLYTSNVSGTWDLWAQSVGRDGPASSPVLVKKDMGDAMPVGVTGAGVYDYYVQRTGVFRTSMRAVGQGAPSSASAVGVVGSVPAWSPDGTSIAVLRPNPTVTGALDLVVHEITTGDERVFHFGGIGKWPPMWFPDGKALLVLAGGPGQRFWFRVDVATGEFTRLAANRGNPGVRTLLPDGKTLYIGAHPAGSMTTIDHIVALNLSSGTTRDVFPIPLDASALPESSQECVLAAGPDGTQIAMAFMDHSTNLTHLAVVGTDGRGYRELTSPVAAQNLGNKLAWSRDGHLIFFTTRLGAVEDDRHQLMRMPAAGGTPEALWTVEGLNSFDVSPDGARIAFDTLRPDGAAQSLWALDLNDALRGR
jgi:Tol biopolymer transport system component